MKLNVDSKTLKALILDLVNNNNGQPLIDYCFELLIQNSRFEDLDTNSQELYRSVAKECFEERVLEKDDDGEILLASEYKDFIKNHTESELDKQINELAINLRNFIIRIEELIILECGYRKFSIRT